jgi:hypothetical protein
MLGSSKPDVVFPVPETMQNLPENDKILLTEIKTVVIQERIKVVMSANVGLVLMLLAHRPEDSATSARQRLWHTVD